MQLQPWRKILLNAALALATALPFPASASEDTDSLKQEVAQLRQEVASLRALIKDRLQQGAVKPAAASPGAAPDIGPLVQVKGESAPAFESNSGVHLSGYGTIGYMHNRNSGDSGGSSGKFNMVGFSPIFHYQYKDILLFQAEMEIMAQPDGASEFALEYANLNYFLNDNVTLFAGKFITPIGYFFQNLHPAWINKFPSKPPGFGVEGAAAPESDIGAGMRGGFHLAGAMRANYALYAGNGPRLALAESGDEIEAIEAEGATSTSSKKGTTFIGGRIGLLPMSGLELGVSAGTSKVAIMNEATRDYKVAGADISYRNSGLDLRGEYIRQSVADLAGSVAPEGGTWKTWYAQMAYRIPSTQWEPVLRYGDFKSQHADQKLRQWGLGLNYWITSNAVGKIAYEFNKGESGTSNNTDRLLLQAAFGF